MTSSRLLKVLERGLRATKQVRYLSRNRPKASLLMKVDNKAITRKLVEIEKAFVTHSSFSESKKDLIETHLRKVIEISNYLFLATLICLLILILLAAYFSREMGFLIADSVVKYRYLRQPFDDFFISLETLNYLYFAGFYLVAIAFLREIFQVREKNISTNLGSRILGLFFTVLIPVCLTILVFRSNSIQVNRDSASLFFANVIQLNLSIFLAVLSVIVSNAFKHFALSQNCPESHVVALLCNSLIDIRRLSDWYSSKHRGIIAKRIDGVASCFEYYIPQSFSCGTPYDYYALKLEFKKISNGFRSLKQWLHTPTTDTKESLTHRLVNDIDLILYANLDSLTKVDFSEHQNISKRQLINQEIRRYISTLIRASIPFALVFLLSRSDAFNISDEASTYLSIGAFALSSVILFIELDPNIGDKLNVLSQIKSLLSRDP